MAKPHDEDDEDADRWKHDDPTESSPRQRRVDELRAHSESMRHTYQKTLELWEQIQRNLRNPWKKAA